MSGKRREEALVPELAVIVPVLNEEATIPAFLEAARTWPDGCQLVFADGGSTDATRELLDGFLVVEGGRGRGAECRLAADRAEKLGARWLAFMHADCLVDSEAIAAVMRALDDGVQWGCLTLRFDTAGPALAFGALMSNLRVKTTGIAFGDQVMFMTRRLYRQVGGMPCLPLMEDYELSRRLRAVAKPHQLSARVVTSARRFAAGGVVRTMLKMRYLRFLYRRGMPPEELAKRYGQGR